MGTEHDDERVVAGLRATIEEAVRALEAAGVRDEAFASYRPARRVLVFTLGARLSPVGRGWRLGVFLLDRAGMLYATGSILRVRPPGWGSYQSSLAQTRNENRAAALRGGFTVGETVNFGFERIALDAAALRLGETPLLLSGERALVRWSPTVPEGRGVDFARYLAEQVDLLAHPPEGA